MRLISKDLLIDTYRIMVDLDPMIKNELVDTVLSKTEKEITSSDIKKAISVFFKSRLVSHHNSSGSDSDDKLIKIENRENFLRLIDEALLLRLLIAIDESGSQYDTDAISRVLYGEYSKEEFNHLLLEVREEINKL